MSPLRWLRSLFHHEEPAPKPFHDNVRVMDADTGELICRVPLERGQTSVQIPDGTLEVGRLYRVGMQFGDEGLWSDWSTDVSYQPLPDVTP